jgi:hypothetical protein
MKRKDKGRLPVCAAADLDNRQPRMESHVSIGEWFKELQHYGYQRFSTHESRRKQRYFAPSRRVKVTER